MMNPQWQELGNIRHEEFLKQAEEDRQMRKLRLQNNSSWRKPIARMLHGIAARLESNNKVSERDALPSLKQTGQY